MEIEGKRVLITGASRGLGRALVTAFVDAGAAEVIAGTRKREDREALQSARVTPVRLDVTSDRDVEAVARMGAIDILINNAGVAGFGNPLTMDFEAVQEEMAVNYLGVLRVTRAVAPGNDCEARRHDRQRRDGFCESESADCRHLLRDEGGVVVVGPGVARVSSQSWRTRDHGDADDDRYRHESRRGCSEDDERVCGGGDPRRRFAKSDTIRRLAMRRKAFVKSCRKIRLAVEKRLMNYK